MTKVLMKGNEAIAEAGSQSRLQVFLWLSDNASEPDTGIYEQKDAGSRRHVPSGRIGSSGDKHGIRRSRCGSKSNDIIFFSGYQLETGGDKLYCLCKAAVRYS